MPLTLISFEQLRKICTLLSTEQATLVADAINKVCPQYGMDTDILHEFLANVAHESKEFTRYEENMNYSAKRIIAVWPSRFKTLVDATPYANNPKKLANKVYGGRLGNTEAMDGWDFRGSGPIQMTGKALFVQFGTWMSKCFKIQKTAREWAQLVRTDHEAGLHSACWIFSVAKGLNDEAQKDDIITIIRRINGGLIGKNERLKYYELCRKVI